MTNKSFDSLIDTTMQSNLEEKMKNHIIRDVLIRNNFATVFHLIVDLCDPIEVEFSIRETPNFYSKS